MSKVLFTLVFMLIAVQLNAANGQPERYLLIVSGISGGDYYADLFQRRASTLLDVARDHLHIPDAHIHYLAEDPTRDPEHINGPAKKEPILAALADIADRSQPGDRVLVVLIGHGTASGDRVLFNIPGPDLSSEELADALDELDGREVAVVNTTPASAPFVEALSAPERIIIAATSTGVENYHTLFADPFVAALASDAADADKDGQVSLLEAFEYSKREVEQRFKEEGRIQTEHAQLDDNGDGIGSREPDPENGDGALARRFVLTALVETTDDALGRERLRYQIAARELVDRIETLKRLKPSLETDVYEERLEALLVELALNRRAWRALDNIIER